MQAHVCTHKVLYEHAIAVWCTNTCPPPPLPCATHACPAWKQAAKPEQEVKEEEEEQESGQAAAGGASGCSLLSRTVTIQVNVLSALLGAAAACVGCAVIGAAVLALVLRRQAGGEAPESAAPACRLTRLGGFFACRLSSSGSDDDLKRLPLLSHEHCSSQQQRQLAGMV